MNSEFLALVLDRVPVAASAKLLLMCLVDRADADGFAFVGRADLMERSGLGRTCVTKWLRILEADEWIARRQRFQNSNVFWLNVPRLLALRVDYDAETTSLCGVVL